MSNKTSGFKRAIGIVLGVITMLVLIALFVVLVMAPIPNIWVDKVPLPIMPSTRPLVRPSPKPTARHL